MARRKLDSLTLTAVATVLILILCLMGMNRLPVLGWLAAPLVLYLPGYALSRALFDHTLEPPERLLVSVAASIALAILAGLVLNLTPIGLQVSSWVVLLSAVTLLAAIVAWRRKEHAASVDLISPLLRFRPMNLILAAFAVGALAAAFYLAQMPVPAERGQGYTALWIQPRSGANAPVRFGMTSEEIATETYRVELVKGDQIVETWQDIVLQPGASWSQAYVSPDALARQQVQVVVYRTADPNTVYRRVLLQPLTP